MSKRILKAGSAASDAQTTYNFLDLRQRCDDYVDRIRLQCREWVTDAQNESDAIRQAAYEQGRRDGLADGLADAAEQIRKQSEAKSDREVAATLSTALPALQAAAREVAVQREAWQQRWEQDAVHLSLAVAERLTRATLDGNADAIAERIREAVSLAAGDGQVTLRLPPRDLDAIGELTKQLPDVAFVADDTLSPGDCIATTEEGTVDGRVAVQIEQIERELFA